MTLIQTSDHANDQKDGGNLEYVISHYNLRYYPTKLVRKLTDARFQLTDGHLAGIFPDSPEEK